MNKNEWQGIPKKQDILISLLNIHLRYCSMGEINKSIELNAINSVRIG